MDDPNQSRQRLRSGVLLIPAGTRSDEMDDAGYRSALKTAWMKGTFGYFGFSPRKLELLCGSTRSSRRRQTLLEKSHQIGLDLAPPKRPHGQDETFVGCF
ncbi:MAG: hypothetical protein P1V34_19640 [Alphaproteobacteria bacterium]|nr:hypothetical protein [Alphaproteobacteria bacterium]